MNPSALRLPSGVVLQPGAGNLDRVAIDVPECTGEIYLHGAHVTGWTPRGGRPVIWMSGASAFAPGRPIRGGIPLCFPWFGPHPANAALPAHGFARLVPWALEGVRREGESIRVTLGLRTGTEWQDAWPHRCALTCMVDFGARLAVELAVRNVGDSSCTFDEALHTYFGVGDVRQVAVEGLAGTTCVDKTRGGERRVEGIEPIRFTGETDRVYLGIETAATIVDAAWQRRIVVRKHGSRTTVVWNPWIAKARAMPDFGDDEWPAMVCVETANALDDAITLPPGGEHRLRAEIHVE
jgi:glucose-6-phosphate 1-epimerase